MRKFSSLFLSLTLLLCFALPAQAAVTPVVSAGGHSLALMSDGTVWAWGGNGAGQLGDGTTTHRLTPVQVGNLTGVTAISAGIWHSLALRGDGTVWAWGSNFFGRLGDGTTTDRHTPVQVGSLTGVTAISAGSGHSLALRGDGTVWAWGQNVVGQLGGGGTNFDHSTPVQVRGESGVGYLTGVTAISAEYTSSFALRGGGTVWAWGGNSHGQLGDGTTTHRSTPVQVRDASGLGYLTGVTAISAAASHPLALKGGGMGGTVWAWGHNYSGNLGDGTNVGRFTPAQVKDASGLGYLTGVTAISAGWEHSLALRGDGTIWGWGRNGSGELGDGTITDRWLPTLVAGIPVINPINHTVTFNSQGGSAVQNQVVLSDFWVTEPVPPTRTGFTFAGWYRETTFINRWNFATDTVTGNITLFARWTETPPTISTQSIPDGVVGAVYPNFPLQASGTVPITWSIESGSLPAGLTLSTAGVISGTPTAAGTFNFTVRAENVAGNATRALSILITTTHVAPTIITTNPLPEGAVGIAYVPLTLEASGTTPTWTVESGSLPGGLDLSTAGIISGTPTAAGTFNFTVRAENVAGHDTRALTIVINAAPVTAAPVITTNALPGGVIGAAYNQTLNASGTTPITWSIVGGSLPNGLNLSTAGVISGTPMAAGTFNFTVQASNPAGSDTAAFSITVQPAPGDGTPPPGGGGGDRPIPGGGGGGSVGDDRPMPGGGGGSGCNIASGLLAMLLTLPLFFAKRKR